MILDLFAGPGGWSEGLRALGRAEVGVEWDADACATARAAGHARRQDDVAELSPVTFAPLEGLIASPPCQSFSMAGKGGGRRDTDHVLACAAELAAGRDTRAEHADRCEDPRSMLVVEPLRWALATRPEWVALEQVPPVLPLWEVFGRALAARGYSTWCGVLEAERYGVPQTRERAILIASRVRPVHPPRATHQRYVKGEPPRQDHTLEGEILPWVSMADALGWGMTGRPGMSVAAGTAAGGQDPAMVGGSGSRAVLYGERDADRWKFRATNARPNASERGVDQPAPSLAFGHNPPRWEYDSHAAMGDGQRERHGDRPTRNQDEPAPAMTGKTRSHEWVNERPVWLRAGTNDHDVSRADTEPAPTIRYGGRMNDVSWVNERPTTTVAGDPRIQPPSHKTNAADVAAGREYDGSAGVNAIRVTVQEAAVLQSFPLDYPWQGSRTSQFQQIGNAIPPLLARAILATLIEGAHDE